MKLIKEIKSKTGELHFKRWQIFSCRFFSIYIHGIYKADEDFYLHDHPWNYFSILLKGYFTERVKDKTRPGKYLDNILGPGSFVFKKAEDFHKIQQLRSPSIYTLFIAGRRRREWGYDVQGTWIDHVTFRKQKHEK